MELNELTQKVQNNEDFVVEEDVAVYCSSTDTEEFYRMDCYDGFAIGVLTGTEDGTPVDNRNPTRIVMIYPEREDLLKNKGLTEQVLRYRGLEKDFGPEEINYGDIMMALGEISDHN